MKNLATFIRVKILMPLIRVELLISDGKIIASLDLGFHTSKLKNAQEIRIKSTLLHAKVNVFNYF